MFLLDQDGPSLPANMTKAADFGSGVTTTSLAASGNATVAGTLGVTGAASFAGAMAGLKMTPITGTADVVLTAAQSGAVVYCSKGSGNQLVTLPAKAAGLLFTVVCANTATGMTIKPGDATAILRANARTAGADAAALASTANTGSLVNTQATAVLGDHITLHCDGTDWWAIAQSGIFAKT